MKSRKIYKNILHLINFFVNNFLRFLKTKNPFPFFIRKNYKVSFAAKFSATHQANRIPTNWSNQEVEGEVENNELFGWKIGRQRGGILYSRIQTCRWSPCPKEHHPQIPCPITAFFPFSAPRWTASRHSSWSLKALSALYNLQGGICKLHWILLYFQMGSSLWP